MANAQSYMICSTPRTGSTLLCSLLKSSGIAGTPHSYFRRQDIERYAHAYGIENLDSIENYKAYAKASIQKTSTENGIYGVRVMWGTLDEMVAGFEGKGADREILESVFGAMKYVYLKREDTIAQAVSLLKALQSDIWHVESRAVKAQDEVIYCYDFDKLKELVSEMEAHNLAWETWFKENNIEPYRIVYEEYEKSPILETEKVLKQLGLSYELSELKAVNKKLSDAVSVEWIERYKQDIRN
ncbi:MAG: Stf0 family sulfotransferase [Alphaproteobacteria bacterium]|nr:Stf0 family sulfotransferase [Alphaproteobacteria bacterium]